MSINKKYIIEIIKKYGKKKEDSGSTKVQVAIFTYNINYLHKHFIKNRKDYHSKIGLLKMVSKRRKLLNYLQKNNKSDYINLIKNLKLRR